MASDPKRSRPKSAAPEEETLPPAPVSGGPPTDPPAVSEQPTLPPPQGTDQGSPSASASPSLVGKSFGDFEILAEIGRGGMGVVYKARQKSLDRLVALKVLLENHFQNPALLTRFLTEARAAAALTHPNIVTVYQVGECPVGRFMAMELIDGRSLEDIVKARVVPVVWAVGVMIQVAEAVHYAHGKGIVHRDLKPANVMIDKHGRPVVMDFGIAKFVGKPSSLTQQGVIIGTPAYMPPEQADDDAGKVGPHSDVYSLGAILYTLLTGKLPFDAGSALHTLMMVVSAEPPLPIRSRRPEVAAELERIVLKSMSKRPADRHPGARALADELRRFRAKPSGQWATPGPAKAVLPRVLLACRTTKKVFRVLTGKTVLGRSSECDIVLKAAEVSKRHCQVTVDGKRVEIEDLDSANGVLVNGELVLRAALRDGDELDIGGYVFQVRIQKDKGN
jgi:serine/threonine protein kinase